MVDKCLQRFLNNIIRKEVGYKGWNEGWTEGTLLKNPSIFRMSAVFSHIVFIQGSNYDTTQI